MSRKNILMVEDTAEMVEVVGQILDPEEFFFVSAKDGIDALLKIKNQKFDLIVCDLKMPRMDGIAFMQELRKLEKDKHVPVIVFSANIAEKRPHLKLIKNVFTLDKPCQGYEILNKIRSLSGSTGASTQEASEGQSKDSSQGQYEADAFIFKEGEVGEDIWFIESGEVALLKEFSDGHFVEVDRLGAGDILGLMTTPDNKFRFCTAKTIKPTKLKPMPLQKIYEEFQARPKWFQALVTAPNQRLINAFKKIKELRKAS
jgi:two-component system chemotaxis response regulator CheY